MFRHVSYIGSVLAICMLLTVDIVSLRPSESLKVDFKLGTSKQGNILRASVALSWLAAKYL